MQWFHYQNSDSTVFILLNHMAEKTMLPASIKLHEHDQVRAVYPRVLWSKHMWYFIVFFRDLCSTIRVGVITFESTHYCSIRVMPLHLFIT